MTSLLDRLRERGWRLTSQRRVIAEVLSGEGVHLAADEVHALARRVLPDVSLATVYNTVNELVALGELVEVNHADGRKRYDTNVLEPHHHLVCVDCGQMRDVAVTHPHLPRNQQQDFELLGVDVTFRGRCPDCVAA